MKYSPINDGFEGGRGGVSHNYTSRWLTENDKSKYFNKVAHMARVNLRHLKEDGYSSFKIRHYHLDSDEFVDGIDVDVYGSEVTYYKN